MNRFEAIAQRPGVAAGQHGLHFRQDGERHLPGMVGAKIESHRGVQACAHGGG